MIAKRFIETRRKKEETSKKTATSSTVTKKTKITSPTIGPEKYLCGPNWFVYENRPGLFGIYVMLKAGAVHEPASVSGISHLLEHLLFKSQQRRIQHHIRKMGGNMNAFTSKDITAYHLLTGKEDMAKAVDIAAEVAFRFDVTEKELEDEKRIVLQEKNETENNPIEMVVDAAWAGTPYAKSVIGSRRSICAVTMEDLRSYFEEKYMRSGCVVTATCPASDLESAASLLDKHFAHRGLPVNDMQYDFLLGRDNYIQNATYSSATSFRNERQEEQGADADAPKHVERCPKEEDLAGPGQKEQLLVERDDKADIHGYNHGITHGQGIKKCRLVAIPHAGAGMETGCTIVFRSKPYTMENNAKMEFVKYVLASGLLGTWYEALREREQFVYRLHMDCSNTNAGAGVFFVRFVTLNDVLQVFGELGDMVRTVVSGGLFDVPSSRGKKETNSRSKHQPPHKRSQSRTATNGGDGGNREKERQETFEYLKSMYIKRMRVNYASDVRLGLREASKNAFYESGPLRRRFATPSEMVSVIETFKREDIERAAVEIFCNPLVVSIGNNVTKRPAHKFRKEAEKAVKELLKIVSSSAVLSDAGDDKRATKKKETAKASSKAECKKKEKRPVIMDIDFRTGPGNGDGKCDDGSDSDSSSSSSSSSS